jgi:hypothetical protein
MAQQTQIQGNRYSFTSIAVQANGADIARGVFRSINYDASQDPGIVQGNQVTIVGRTSGYGTGTGSFEMLVSECDDFFADLSSAGAFPVMGIDFDISVSYGVNDVDVRIDKLVGCRITKIGAANQQGNDASTRSCDISIARMYQNGVALFADPAAG